ncbi:MAG: amidohydrolase family protein [Deltaproteobacteria bacterium]
MIDLKGNKLEVIDAHVHMGISRILKLMTGKDKHLGEDVIEHMDALGIDKCVAFSVAHPDTDYSAANDVILEQVKKYPNRIIGFGRVNPNFGAENCVKEIDRFVKLGLRGLKLHPGFEFHIPNDKAIYPIFETVRKHKIPILYHAGTSHFCNPATVADMATDFPEISVIIPHFAYTLRLDAIALAKRVKNLFLDTAGCFAGEDTIKMAVKTVGLEKIIFGSDDPFEPVERELEKLVKYSGLTTDELKAVFSENLKRLLKI